MSNGRVLALLTADSPETREAFTKAVDATLSKYPRAVFLLPENDPFCHATALGIVQCRGGCAITFHRNLALGDKAYSVSLMRAAIEGNADAALIVGGPDEDAERVLANAGITSVWRINP